VKPANARQEIPVQKITPFLWFDDRIEEAVRLYVSIFGKSKVVSVAHHNA
jgi:predicted 3-demethylubiquinone-9 3-methyltransferase (glyoxalase superfamily)